MADQMAIIEKYFSNLTEIQLEQFSKLSDLYTEWNEKINVISRKDIDSLMEKHVLHALSIAKFTDLSHHSVLDVGTGGGFPGIPLAIMFPDAQFTLVDSIGKKITVVKEVSEAIGLTNLLAYHQRAEKVKGKYDFVVSRAVTRMKKFLPWVNEKIIETEEGSNGIVALKGGDLTEEMEEIKRPYQEVSISEYFKEDFFETKKIIHIPF